MILGSLFIDLHLQRARDDPKNERAKYSGELNALTLGDFKELFERPYSAVQYEIL